MPRKRRPLAWLLTDLGQFPDCGACTDYLLSPWLGEAIASCAIENGADPQDLERRVVEHFHLNGHQERP